MLVRNQAVNWWGTQFEFEWLSPELRAAKKTKNWCSLKELRKGRIIQTHSFDIFFFFFGILTFLVWLQYWEKKVNNEKACLKVHLLTKILK